MTNVLNINYSHRNRALHEAAHAVVGIALGCTVDYLEIAPSPSGGGQCVFRDADELEDFDSLAMKLAGMRAELHDPGCEPFLHPATWQSDWDGCVRILSERYARPVGDEVTTLPIMLRAGERAAELVETFWAEICEVASLALDDFRLDGEEVHRVVRERSLGRFYAEIDKRVEAMAI